EKDRILKDIRRQKVLNELKKDKSYTEEPPEQIDEEIGEEQRLAMADDIKRGNEPESEGNAARSSSGGPSISPVIIQLYGSQLHRKISRNWRIPPGVPTDGSLAALISFKVDGNGRVNNVRVKESSGNSSFDEYCVKAINRSAPLPPPPHELAEEAKNNGVELIFRNDP
ncbi:MAG: energy transducer TonB, partial [Thermodesulfobacteriota bacterium]